LHWCQLAAPGKVRPVFTRSSVTLRVPDPSIFQWLAFTHNLTDDLYNRTCVCIACSREPCETARGRS
jgi:hypothetical protein